MAVQPMKAISAVLLTGQLTPGAVAAAGLLIGVVLLLLGATGFVGKVAKLIPQSVTAGLQLGLGLTMGWLGLMMIVETPWIGVPALSLLFGLPRLWRQVPVAPLVLLAAAVVGIATGKATMPDRGGLRPAPAARGTARRLGGGLAGARIGGRAAVIVTAVLCRDLFPERAGRATVRHLALTSGAANLLLAPFGAMPMCHGAGGVAAQHRFGARTGLAPVLFGVVLLALALGFTGGAVSLLAAIPTGAVGALLLVAGTDLAMSKRLFDARPACWPAIGIAATATALINPAVGLAAGWAVEFVRTVAARAFNHPSRAA
jgi:MFS superfamily sulfate permease-like transporter